MSKIRHTPGPWRVSDDDEGNGGIADDWYHFIEAGAGLCSPPKYLGFEISGCMSMQDARLIAAAPELLEALQMITDRAEEWINLNLDDEVGNKARAAIAKATGSQS